jgi:hypothetical protein
VSWALGALRQRFEQPVYSEQSLTWRHRGPVGALAFSHAIGKEARSEAERCFLLTELCLDLSRVRPQVAPGSLSKARVSKALKELIAEVRGHIAPETLADEPSLAAYARMAFEEEIA